MVPMRRICIQFQISFTNLLKYCTLQQNQEFTTVPARIKPNKIINKFCSVPARINYYKASYWKKFAVLTTNMMIHIWRCTGISDYKNVMVMDMNSNPIQMFVGN